MAGGVVANVDGGAIVAKGIGPAHYLHGVGNITIHCLISLPHLLIVCSVSVEKLDSGVKVAESHYRRVGRELIDENLQLPRPVWRNVFRYWFEHVVNLRSIFVITFNLKVESVEVHVCCVFSHVNEKRISFCKIVIIWPGFFHRNEGIFYRDSNSSSGCASDYDVI